MDRAKDRLAVCVFRQVVQIKVVAPNVALDVVDRAIQLHGGAGGSGDFPAGLHVRDAAYPAFGRWAR